VVQVSINGSGPHSFLLNTGSNRTLVGNGLLETLRISPGRLVRANMATEVSYLHQTVVSSVAVAGLAVHDLAIESGYGNGPPFFRVGNPFAFTWIRCRPSTPPKTGLSFVAVIEFTTNQSRNPFGNGTPSSADTGEGAANVVKITARPRTPASLHSIGLLLRPACGVGFGRVGNFLEFRHSGSFDKYHKQLLCLSL
jgi:hypothetical protein